MKRANFFFTEKQLAWLARRAKATGLSAAEIMRRLIDAEVQREKEAKKK